MNGRHYTKADKRPQDEGPVYEHMKKVLRFLWDEGPHIYDDVAEFIGLSRYRTIEIISFMKHEGLVETFRRERINYVKVCDHVELADNEN